MCERLGSMQGYESRWEIQGGVTEVDQIKACWRGDRAKGNIASSPNRKTKASKEGVVKEGKGGVAMWVWQWVLTALSPAGGGRAPPVW